MKLSFVIPAHDEAAVIGPTLRAIHDAVPREQCPYEIIVAADGCTDATAEIALAHGARVVAHERRQIAATRNLGARAATGEILVFVDADTRVTSGAIAELLAAMQRGAVGGGGPVRVDDPVPLYAHTLLAVLITLFRWMKLTGGAFLFCTRAAFERAGGWDETYYAGEEIQMARQLKRLGHFVIVREAVITSGRKFRTHRPVEMVRLLLRGVFTPWAMKDRAKLDFFYGPRRKDPMDGAPPPQSGSTDIH